MNFIRNHKKISISILVVSILFLFFGTTFARYVYNVIHNHILESKEFYFNSSVLDINNKQFRINNWDGVNNYVLTIDVNNQKNSLKFTNSDIKYQVEVSCPENVECQLSKTEGIIYKDKKTDSYQITVIPKEEFYEGDEVEIMTKATSIVPYVKTISATYTIGIQTSNFSYDIEDSKNEKVAILNLTNSVTYYEVENSFENYQKGDRITSDEYQLLSDTEKNHCFSAKVRLSFNPKILFLDMTNSKYLHMISGSEQLQKVNGFDYVSGFSFKMDASSSEKILFFKADPTQNFTYPIINDTPIIDVYVETAE